MKLKLLIVLTFLCIKVLCQGSLPTKAFVTSAGQEIPFSGYTIKEGVIEYIYRNSSTKEQGSINFSEVDYFYDTSLSGIPYPLTFYPTTLPNGEQKFLRCRFVGKQKLYMKFRRAGNHNAVEYYLGDKGSSSLVLISGALMTKKEELRKSLLKRIKSNQELYKRIDTDSFVYNVENIYPVLSQFILDENRNMIHDTLNAKVVFFGKSKKWGNGVKLKLLGEEYFFHEDFYLQIHVPSNISFTFDLNGEERYLTCSSHYSEYYEIKPNKSDPNEVELKFTIPRKALAKIRYLPKYKNHNIR